MTLLFFCDATDVACLEAGMNKGGRLRLTCSGHSSCAKSRHISDFAGSDLSKAVTSPTPLPLVTSFSLAGNQDHLLSSAGGGLLLLDLCLGIAHLLKRGFMAAHFDFGANPSKWEPHLPPFSLTRRPPPPRKPAMPLHPAWLVEAPRSSEAFSEDAAWLPLQAPQGSFATALPAAAL